MADPVAATSAPMVDEGLGSSAAEVTPAEEPSRPVRDPRYNTAALRAWRRRTDAPLLVLAIGSLPLLLLEIERSELTWGDRAFLDTINVLVLVAFAVDYLVEVACVSDRALYVRREWTSAVIVLAQVAALLPALSVLGALRVLRAARAGRAVAVVARLFAIGGAAASEGRTILRDHAAAFALGTAGFTWITSAVAFTLVEDVGRDGRLHSFFDALWWSSATITTVGYGDVYPVTAVGRIVGVITMVVGISTFAVVTAKVAQFLVRSESERGS